MIKRTFKLPLLLVLIFVSMVYLVYFLLLEKLRKQKVF